MFTVSVEGDGTVVSPDYTVGEDNPYRPDAIYIIGCKPTTKIKIESTYGKFYLQTMKVYDIDEALFYESFNYHDLTTTDKAFGYSSDYEAVISDCDNYSGVSFSSIQKAYQKIFFNNSATYTLPTVSFEGSKDMLMTFKVAMIGIGTRYVGLSTSDDTQMTDFDSTDRSTLYDSRQLTLDGGNRVWQNHSIIIKDMTSSTVLTISGKNIHLDDVMLRPIPSGLSQSQDNSAFIEANSGQTMDVNVTRTLTKDKWCPLCLPFDVTPSLLATAASTSCEVRRPGSVTDGIFSLDKVESDETISAGTPFLVKPAATVSTLSFTSVTISDAAASSDSFNGGDYQFVGCYSPVFLTTDGTNLFLGTDGNLYKPDTDIGYNLLGGLRAYFIVPTGEESSRVFFSDEVYTGVMDMLIERSEDRVFDLQGRNITSRQLRPGLYISQGRKYVVR